MMRDPLTAAYQKGNGVKKEGGPILFRPKQIMAIANAERRVTRRLVRYWIFLGLAYLIGFVIHGQLVVLHGLLSSVSGSVGGLAPRFLLSMTGLYYSVIFIVGTIFLAFDIRARDMRERMSEVLDSRPYTNLELVTGRFVGVFFSSWIPMVVLIVLFEIAGLLMQGLNAPFGEPLEVLSVISFLIIMAIPALAFVIALVFFVTLLVRNRLAAAVILLALIILSFWGLVWLPSPLNELFDITGFGATFFTSEMVPGIATPDGLIQRLSVLLAAFALLGFSAAVHPRLDGGSRPKLTAGSTIAMVLAIILTGILYLDNTKTIRIKETWKEAHAAITDQVVPDIKKIAGDVKISPGKDLLLDLDITFGAPDTGTLQKALFTLNPGQKVTSVSDFSGESITFTHENGLLEFSLPQPLGPGDDTTIHLTVNGLPDYRFAYLFSSFSLETSTGVKAGDIPLLGVLPGIFDKAFVALMPGQRWLPVSGSENGRDDPRIRAVDYFDVDLKVDLPEGWLAAGPGRRNQVEGDSDGASYRFSPPAPVPEVALVASRFESRAMEIEGVTFEVLMNRKHTKNFEVLADTSEKIQEWVGGRFREAKEFGLGYPYDALTLVEVPNTLRSYGGGWRLDTALTAPGILLMRETGFPTARFDTAFRNPENFEDKEGGIQQAKWIRLKNFFSNDLSGGNVFSASARNFFTYQTSAKGPEGLALNYVMESLTEQLLMETKSYFSAHMWIKSDGMDRVVNTTLNSYFGAPSREANIVDTVTSNAVSRPEVWDQALSVSLNEMDPWEDPASTVDVLTLKANAVAQSILDTLGTEKTIQLLASIREAHQGSTYSLDDMMEAGKTLGYDLTEILGDWLGSADMAGFVCQEVKIYRIPDSEDGSPRYQMLFTIRNDESAPGFFRIAYYYTGEGRQQDSIKSDPIRLAGKSTVRYGSIVSKVSSYQQLEPYLSLNRTNVMMVLYKLDLEKIEKKEPIEGLEELPYVLPREDFIIVDDLDSGFSVIEGKKRKGLRINAKEDEDRTTDQGLPVTGIYRIPSTWSRAVYWNSYGKYRHTLAVVKAGKGEKKASFTTDIPKSGKWDLELFIPFKPYLLPNRKWGTYNLTVTDGNGDQKEIIFDSQAAGPNWNMAESFYLPEGETTLTLSNETDGQFVVADAIRWTPVVE